MDDEGGIAAQSGVHESNRWVRAVAVFLAVSYVVGAPVGAALEYRDAILSQRFDYPPALIYVTAAIQIVCVVGVLMHRFAAKAATALSVITVGAIASHLKIGSPLTAIPALLYTVVQIWFALARHQVHKT